MIVITESGSSYVLERDTMTWGRFRGTPDRESLFAPVRTKEGKMLKFPEVKVGESMTILCPPLVEGTIGRMISTSFVVEIILD